MFTLSELKTKYARPENGSCFININGTEIHYRDEGEGFPVLLVHGTSSSLHTFDGWATELRKKYRVLRFDMPGFGLSGTMPDNDFSLDNYLKLIDDFLGKMNAEKCHIAGSSLGGWFSWEFALKYPHRIHKLILIDAAGFITKETLPFIYKVARLPIGRMLFMSVSNRKIFSVFCRGVYGNYRNIEKQVYDRYFELFFRKENLDSFLKIAQNDPFSNADKLCDITSPALIMWGSKDKWVSINDGYQFEQRIPKSKLIIYKGLGHVPMEENPSLTVKDAIAFFEENV
jgi:pimeloyl-ACP methyl ester carboxylesterase